jgi:pilus assembly protein Flp/PilA
VEEGSDCFLKLAEQAARQKGESQKMTKFYIMLLQMLRSERGQDLVEYALLAGLVAVAAGAALPNVGRSFSTIFSRLSSVVTNAAA